VTRDKIAEARGLIEDGAIEWFDFCANFGHIPDNVRHMASIVRAFAEWLDNPNA
jgi:hypothetical protein